MYNKYNGLLGQKLFGNILWRRWDLWWALDLPHSFLRKAYTTGVTTYKPAHKRFSV